MPDTLIWFINGESIIVKDRLEDIQQKVISLRAEILRRAQNVQD